MKNRKYMVDNYHDKLYLVLIDVFGDEHLIAEETEHGITIMHTSLDMEGVNELNDFIAQVNRKNVTRTVLSK